MALASFVLNLVVDNPYTHQLIRRKLNDVLEKYTEIEVEFSAIKVSVVPLGVTLYSLKISPRTDPKFEWISAVKIKAEVSLWAAMLGDFRLSVVEANQLNAVWPMPYGFPGFLKSTDEDLRGPPEPEGPFTWPLEFDLPVDRLVLVNSNMSIDIPITEEVPLPVHTLYLTATGVNLDTTYRSWSRLKGDLEVDGFDLAIDSSLIVDDTALEGSFSSVSEVQFNLTDLKMNGPRVRYQGEGGVEFKVLGDILNDIDLKLKGQLKGDISILGSFLELANTHGGVTGDATVGVKIPIESVGDVEFLVEGKGQLEDGYLDGYRLFDSSTEFKVTGDGVWLDNLHLIIGGQEYGRGKGHLSFDQHLPFEFETELQGTRLWDLFDSIGVDFKLVDVAVHSTGLAIKGQGNPFSLEAKGRTVLSDILLPQTPYDHSRYPLSPHCRTDLKVKVDLKEILFNQTKAVCYQPRQNTVEPWNEGEIRAPSGAQFVTELNMDGGVDFTHGIGVRVEAPSFQLPLAQFFAQVPLQGAGSMLTLIEGPVERVKIETTVDLSEVDVLGIGLGRVRGTTTVVDNMISWKDLKSHHEDGSQITVTRAAMAISDDKLTRIQGTLKNLSPRVSQSITKAFVPAVPLAFGVTNARIEYEAPLFVPLAATGFIEAQLFQISYQKEPLADTLEMMVDLEPTVVSTKKLTLTKGSLKGSLDVTLNREELAHYVASRDLLVPYSPKFQGEKHKDVQKHDLGQEKATNQIAGQKNEKAPFQVDDWGLGLFKSYDVSLVLQESVPGTPGGLESLPFAGSLLKQNNITGALEANAKISGNMDSGAMGIFSLHLDQFKMFGSPLAPVRAEGFIKQDKVELTFNHSGRVVEGRLSFDLAKTGIPYDLFVNMDKFDLRFLAGEVFSSDPRNYLYWTGDVKLSGNFDDFLRSTGALHVNDIRFSYARDVGAQTRRILVRQYLPVKILLKKNQWSFEGEKTLFLTGDSLQLRVSMGENSPPEKLNIAVDSLVDVGLAREFFPGVDTAEGQLKASLKIWGSLTDPQLRLDLSDAPSTPFNAGTWRPVTLGFSDLRPAFRNIKLDVGYEDGELKINNFRSDKGGGQVVAQGSLALRDDVKDISRLGISFNNATLVYPMAFIKSFETQVTGDLIISGSKLPYDVKGNIVVNRARSTKDVDIRNEIINALRQRSLVTEVSTDKPSVNLNVRVTADETIGVNIKNIQSVLSCDLAITGTDIAPIVRGQIDVDKGKFIYKRDFQIVRGGINFDDPVKPDPSLDVVAVSDVDNYRVFITISGRASNPSVEFSVDPPNRESGSQISKLEILILLSRGKLPSESRSIGGETEKAAASEAANLILGQFEEPVEKLFSLSGQKFLKNPYLDTHPGPEGNPVPRMNVPLDLGENFDIVFRVDGTNSEAVAEYNIHNNITLNGSLERGQTDNEATSQAVNSDTDAQVNLKFKFSFD